MRLHEQEAEEYRFGNLYHESRGQGWGIAMRSGQLLAFMMLRRPLYLNLRSRWSRRGVSMTLLLRDG